MRLQALQSFFFLWRFKWRGLFDGFYLFILERWSKMAALQSKNKELNWLWASDVGCGGSKDHFSLLLSLNKYFVLLFVTGIEKLLFWIRPQYFPFFCLFFTTTVSKYICLRFLPWSVKSRRQHTFELTQVVKCWAGKEFFFHQVGNIKRKRWKRMSEKIVQIKHYASRNYDSDWNGAFDLHWE